MIKTPALLLVGILVFPAVAFAKDEAPVGVCEVVTVKEGDPIPDDACAVQIISGDTSIEGMIFGNRDWVALDEKSMPNIFYDKGNLEPVAGNPAAFDVDLMWTYEFEQSTDNSEIPYLSSIEPVRLNCKTRSYSVNESQYYSGKNATGSQVMNFPVQGAKNVPTRHDPVKQQLQKLICRK